jgi:hypothetical protein
MIYDLADLLDQLDSARTGADRQEMLRLIREVSDEDSCCFTFKVKEIQPTYSDAGDENCRGGTTVIGELIDERSEYEMEYLHDQNGQQIELLLPKRWNRRVSRWKEGELIFCSGNLHDWDATDDRYQLLATKIPGFSLVGKLVVWTLVLLFFWWWWWPAWAIYKVAYLVIPVGLVAWAISAWQDNEELAAFAFLMLVIVAPLGLFLRFYVWAINLQFKADEAAAEKAQAEEES